MTGTDDYGLFYDFDSETESNVIINNNKDEPKDKKNMPIISSKNNEKINVVLITFIIITIYVIVFSDIIMV